jgi:hypothetical protein
MVRERFALFDGLSGANPIGQGDVAQMILGIVRRREAQDVGRPGPAAETFVQRRDAVVVCQQYGHPAASVQSRLRRRQHDSLRLGQGRRPGKVLDLYVDHLPARRAASAS